MVDRHGAIRVFFTGSANNCQCVNALHLSRRHISEIEVTEKEPHDLAPEDIEEIEKLTLRWIFQAVSDFGMEAQVIFLKSPDNVQDIATAVP